MTVNDVRKPAWRAFEFLMTAGDERLPVTGFVSPADKNSTISVLAVRNTTTASATGSLGVNVYVANYHRLGDVNRYPHPIPDRVSVRGRVACACATVLLPALLSANLNGCGLDMPCALEGTSATRRRASVYSTQQGRSPTRRCAGRIAGTRTALVDAITSRRRRNPQQTALLPM